MRTIKSMRMLTTPSDVPYFVKDVLTYAQPKDSIEEAFDQAVDVLNSNHSYSDALDDLERFHSFEGYLDKRPVKSSGPLGALAVIYDRDGAIDFNPDDPVAVRNCLNRIRSNFIMDKLVKTVNKRAAKKIALNTILTDSIKEQLAQMTNEIYTKKGAFNDGIALQYK